MAISATHHQLLKSVQPILPRGGTLLEIGEANWYGDVAPDFPCRDTGNLFAIAKDFYADLFAPSKVLAVDMNGTPDALRHDLNHSLPITDRFDVVMNHGTAEHVFNIAQVFATIHRHTKPGGLMIHDAPFTGWIDHGFYTLHPTLFYDLSGANGYKIERVCISEIRSQTILEVETRESVAELAEAGKIPLNANLFVVLRRLSEGQFRLPAQGYYSRTISEASSKAWENLR